MTDTAQGAVKPEPHGIHILRREATRANEPRTGMRTAGLPKVVIEASHAAHALSSYDLLSQERDTAMAERDTWKAAYNAANTAQLAAEQERDRLAERVRELEAERDTALTELDALRTHAAGGDSPLGGGL